MAARKERDEPAAGARRGPAAAADGANLTALVTTMVAGAVTGAVAGVIESRDGQAAQQAVEQTRALDDQRDRPNDHHEATAAPAPSGAVTPDETAGRTDAVSHPARLDSPVFGPETAEHRNDGESLTSGVSARLAPERLAEADGGSSPTAEAGHGGSTAATAATANEATPAVEAVPIVASASIEPVVQSITQIIESKLSPALSELKQHLADLPSEITGQALNGLSADLAATGDSLSALGTTMKTAFGDLSNAIGEVTQSATSTIHDIPSTILGAEPAQQSFGALEHLFEGPGQLIEAPDLPALPAVAAAALPEPASESAPGQAISSESGVFDAVAVLGQTVETVKIGFIGQSYADSHDMHDGMGGAHGNLLHGLV